eukprot:3118276-Prymnesium_polylepis.1
MSWHVSMLGQSAAHARWFFGTALMAGREAAEGALLCQRCYQNGTSPSALQRSTASMSSDPMLMNGGRTGGQWMSTFEYRADMRDLALDGRHWRA